MKARKHLAIRSLHVRIPLWWPDLLGNWHTWLPSRGNVLFTLSVVAGLLYAGRAGALPLGEPAVPALFPSQLNYQGYVQDLNGVPLNGEYDMVFSLYNDPDGTNLLWQEEWITPTNQISVTNGLFNVALGRLTPITPAVLDHDALYVGISIDGDPEALPREQLTMVPYAWSANTVSDGAVTTAKIADGAVTSAKLNVDNGLGVNGNLTVNGNAGIGTSDTSTGRLVVAGLVHGGGVSGDAFRIGNDAKLVDIDSANTIGVYGIQDSTVATLKLGSAGGTISGYNGTIGVGGNLNMTGVVQSSNNIPTAALQGGAVTTAKIADGAVTSRKLKPNTFFALHDGDAGITDPGTEFFGPGGPCLEVTSDVLVLITLNFRTNGGAGQVNFHVRRDGTQVGSTFRQFVTTDREVVTIAMVDLNVGPGCHSYSVWGDGIYGEVSAKNFVAIPFAR